jgi:polysaccharide biosynthesis protein PslG
LRRRLSAVACVGLLASLAVPPATHAAAKGVVPDLTWGVSPAEQDRSADAVRDLRATWVRLNANWSDAEPRRGTYDTNWFIHYDRAIDLARDSGAQIILMSYRSPSWASGSSNPETPPRDPMDFARFMGYLAARYAGKVDAFEVWNEENIPRFWSTGPDPAAYTRLLQLSYLAIKQANPTAKVVFGGLSTNDYAFVEGAYSAGAQGFFDVMALHPYPCSNSPETIVRTQGGRMTRSSFPAYREVRASMLAELDDKPIWFTEVGWSTTTKACGVSEWVQAGYLTRAFRFIRQDPYVQMMLWYNLRNNYWDHDADTTEARYGLMRTDYSRKRSYKAFKSYLP